MSYVWRTPQTEWERQVPDHLEFIATDPPGMTYGFRFRPIWHGKSKRWIPVEGDKAVPLGLVQQAPGDMASSTLQQKPLPPAKMSPVVPKVAAVVAPVPVVTPTPVVAVVQTVAPLTIDEELAASSTRSIQLMRKMQDIKAQMEAEDVVFRKLVERKIGGSNGQA